MNIPIYSKLKHAKRMMNAAEKINNECIKKLENQQSLTSKNLDQLGKLEIRILCSFEEFTKVHKELGITPSFAEHHKDNIVLPSINLSDLENAAAGGNMLFNSLNCAAFGAAGGFAAYGAITTAALHVALSSIKAAATIPVVHLASGATIASISTLGASTLTTGGGIAITSSIIATGTGTTLGGVALSAAGPIGLIVGGTIMSISARKLSKKADQAFEEVLKTKKEIDAVCRNLADLAELSNQYNDAVSIVNFEYQKHWNKFKAIVYDNNKKSLKDFTSEEKLITQNLYLLVQLLYHMCQVNLVLKEENNGLNMLNSDGVNEEVWKAKEVIELLRS